MRRATIATFALAALASTVASGAGTTPLLGAVQAGDLKAVRAMLAQKPDVNAAAADGMTALHWAVQNDAPEIVNALLAAGANPRAVTRYGIEPVSLAAGNGNAAVLERLLTRGADPNVAMPDGVTPLMQAARHGSVAAVKVLLAHGAKIDARERARGQNALMWAAIEGNVGAITTLVEAGADINAHSVTKRKSTAPATLAEAVAAAAKSVPVRDPDEPYEETGNVLALRKQFPKGRDTSVPSFGARTNTEGLTPLLFAARAGHDGAVAALLAAGAKIDEPASDGTTALYIAIVNAHWELASSLLDRGANPNAMGRGITPLHQLVVTRRLHLGHLPHPTPTGTITSLEFADRLIKKGADINARMTVSSMGDGYRNRMNRMGSTPFLLAAKSLDPVMMKFLVERGADPTIPNVEHTNALMLAAGIAQFNPDEDAGTEEESLEAVKYALSLGLDVNAADDNGDTALHGTAYKGFNSVAQFLVERGAKLDARNILGWTPLTIANGVMYTSFYKSQRHTAALLATLMKERGIEASTDIDITGAGYVRDHAPTQDIGVPAAKKP